MLNNDPHLGFRIPSIWYTAHLVAPGLNVTGVTFPGNPFVILGHNDHIAWGVTNMQADAVDYFIETVNPENPKQYKHKGEWKNFEEREETINIRGAEPRKAVIRSTIHGPVDEVGGKTIALAWTGLKATTDPKSMVGFNFAKGLPDFLDALKYLEVPALNVIYADVEGNIAIAPHGDLPIRARGKGRVPVDGASGEYDWEGMIPFDALPISINPPRGYLASANGRPAPMEYPHYLGWMWDPSYRTRRINDLLAGQEKISFEDMQKFQYDAHDKAAEVFVPVLLKAFADMSKDNSVTRAAIQVLQSWDFNCTPGMSAPTIFAAWFNNYRSAVWEDEWKSRNITQPGGGWGFTGDNKREPEIEVLEYMTRENPDSIWFDDRLTPERERRDDIIRKSFTTAVDALVKMHGTDINGWNWGKFNVLHVGSLVPNPQLERGGMPVPGGIFTLNPGSDGGWVGGGASWRQVIDMNDLGRSVGVYPGGQSEDAKNPHYDDQIPLWAKGEYAPLWFAARAEEMKLEATVEKKLFKP
ncbi:penicillin acylase family protein [Candidatus Sumerlaeota bacterium]|nr:penicillin acylase family protein [Candidatus Sumerlaeota bacterium]